MESLTDTLYGLLYDREFRAQFEKRIASGANAELSDFETIAWKQLNLFGETIERNTFTGPLVAGKGLAELFPETITKLEAQYPDFRRLFQISHYFAEYSDLNHSRKFLSLEEAFYRFASSILPASEALARHEFLSAHMQNLATHSEPAFSLNPDFVQSLANGHLSIQKHNGEITLYACVKQKFISGPVDASVELIFQKYFVNCAERIEPADQPLVDALEALGFESL